LFDATGVGASGTKNKNCSLNVFIGKKPISFTKANLKFVVRFYIAGIKKLSSMSRVCQYDVHNKWHSVFR